MKKIFTLIVLLAITFTGFVVDGEAKSPEELIQSMDARVSHNYWQNFYQECFAKKYDFSGVEIPKDPGGFETVVIIPQGLTYADIAKAVKNLLPNKPGLTGYNTFYRVAEGQLDSVMSDVRVPDQNYAIRIQGEFYTFHHGYDHGKNRVPIPRGQESDENYVTLREQFIIALMFYRSTGLMLDDGFNGTETHCLGSRNNDTSGIGRFESRQLGYVPSLTFGIDIKSFYVPWTSRNELNKKATTRLVVFRKSSLRPNS